MVRMPAARKGKAFADGLREAGADVVPAARLKRHRDRVAFVRDELQRSGGRCTEDAAEALLARSATTCASWPPPARS